MAMTGPNDGFLMTRLNELASWCRKNSLWPMPFATVCWRHRS